MKTKFTSAIELGDDFIQVIEAILISGLHKSIGSGGRRKQERPIFTLQF